MKIAFVTNSSQCLGIQYVGIRSLAAVLQDAGHEVKLFVDPSLFNDSHCRIKTLNRVFNYKRHIVAQLKEYRPELVGMSVTTEIYPWAKTMSGLIKQAMDVPVIWGGIHPTSVPEEVMRNDTVDMVCVGEGEYPLLELVESMKKGAIDYSIRNIWFKRNGGLVRNEVRPLIADLDALPLSDPGLYAEWPGCLKIGYYIAASRGCPNACSYCCHSFLHRLYQGKGQYVRRRSVSKIIQEISAVKQRYAIKRVLFTDDCFAHDRDWLREFAAVYKEKINLPFFCMMQPRDLTRETVPYLRSAGCRIVFLGIQSWDKELRENLLERFVSNACMEEAINSLKGSGIQLVVDNLFGLPGQDYEQLLQANMKYTALRPKRIFFFHLRYYPKTVMLDKVQGKSDVSADRYTDIVNGTDGGGLCLTLPAGRTSGGDKELKKIKILLFCFDLLPGKAIRFIVNKKLYRYIPSVIAPSLFMFLRTLFSSDLDSRLRIEENVYKYAYFMVKKIRIVLDKRRTNRGNYAADAE